MYQKIDQNSMFDAIWEFPNNLSYSVLALLTLRRYLKSVRGDWNVPNIVAILTLSFNVCKDGDGGRTGP